MGINLAMTKLRRKVSMRDAYAKKCKDKGIWHSTLQRTELKKGTPLKKVSKSQRRRLKEYYEVRNAFLRDNPACLICVVRGLKPAPATEVHHRFGRNASLLSDVRGFVANCRSCRDWPHANPKEARELGLLGEAWEWGVPIDRQRKNAGA